MWASIVAVLGTLAGALTAGLLAHRAARTARAEQRADRYREDQIAAVADFAAALDAHRSAMFHRERLAMEESSAAAVQRDGVASAEMTEHHQEAQTKSHDTRAAITAPHVRLQVLAPALAVPAQTAADATYAMRKANSRADLDAMRRTAKDASAAFVNAAATLLASGRA
ncbi:hypothetical protein AB0B30_38375 [Streptomyces narbonensis]|uniref:Protein kilB n=1 Tax=Streptomyces narbonensis TaxID=67333 RepID=A0ABV3CML2_9ACTN